ncbi:MAG: RidA family protein [Gemmatimonadales bacterium]|nr:RidA family protein [Gemmatimonadales bacterium]
MSNPPIIPVQVPGALPPAGHYSPAIVHGGLVYVSGQLPIDPVSGERCTGNLEMVLHAAGSGLDRLLKVTIYLADVAHWGAVNAVYAQRLGAHRPARAVVPTGPLHHGFLIEVEGIAATRG